MLKGLLAKMAPGFGPVSHLATDVGVTLTGFHDSANAQGYSKSTPKADTAEFPNELNTKRDEPKR